MKCDTARELLSDLHNGELAPREEERLRRHLQDCAPCRGAQRELAQTLELLAGVPPPELPPEFLAALRQQLEIEGRAQSMPAEPAPAVSRPLWARGLQGVGLVVAGAAAVLLILWPPGAPQRPIPAKCSARAPVAAVRPAPREPTQRLRLGQVAVLVMNIRAEEAQPEARLQVVLPDGVALLGEGRREIEEKRMSWTVKLVRGDNEIRIPVRALLSGTWRLVARARAAGFRATSVTRLLVTCS